MAGRVASTIGDYENLSDIARAADRNARLGSNSDEERNMSLQTPSSSSSFPGVVMRRPTAGSETDDFDDHLEVFPQVGTTFYDYQAMENDELSFQRGSVVEIIEKDRERGWVYGKIDDKTGMVPENYVRLIGRQPKEIKASEFVKLDEKVGDGAFCNVFKGIYRGRKVALKIPKQSRSLDNKSFESLKREALVFARLSHKNIVAFYGICTESPCILMELCEGGTLFRLYRQLSFSVYSTVIAWALQIAQGMDHLHNRDDALLHADLKADNILIKEIPCICEHDEQTSRFGPPKYHNNICTRCNGTRLDKLTLKITDFGLSRDVKSTRDSLSGSVSWMSPEVIEKKEYSKSSDVWSFGILFWEILTNQLPFPDPDYSVLVLMVAIGERKKTPDIPENCPPEIRNLMKKCWEIRPENRPSFSEIIEMLNDANASIDKTHVLYSFESVKKSRARMDVTFNEIAEEFRKRRIDTSIYSNLEFKPKAPKPAARTIRRKPRPVLPKGKVSKENIGGPQDFQHTFHISSAASSTSPDSQRFHIVENPDKGVSPLSPRHNHAATLERKDLVDAQTLPRSYKHAVKQTESPKIRQCSGNEHLTPMEFNRNASRSNPELCALSVNNTPRRSNAYRHKDFERIKKKVRPTNSSDSSEENVVIPAEDMDIPIVRHSDYPDHHDSRKSNAIFYDSDSSVSAVSDPRQKRGRLNKFFNLLKKRSSPTRQDQIVDRPLLPQCVHPHHSADALRNFNHQCGLNDVDVVDQVLSLEPELHLLAKFQRLQYEHALNGGRPFRKRSDDPQKRRRTPQPPTPSQPSASRSAISSKVRKARQNTSVSETDGSFDQGFEDDDISSNFNSSLNSNYQTPLSSKPSPIASHRSRQPSNQRAYETPLKAELINSLDLDLEKIQNAAIMPFTNQTYQPMKDSIYRVEKLQRPKTLAVGSQPSSSLGSPKTEDDCPVIEIAECPPRRSPRHMDMSPDLMPKPRSLSEHHPESISPRLPPRPTHLSPSIPNLPISPSRSRNSSNTSLGSELKKHRQRHSVLDQFIEVPDGRKQSPTTHIPFIESPKTAEDLKEPESYFVLQSLSGRDSPPAERAPPPPPFAPPNRVPKIPIRLNKPLPKTPPTFM
ncbi:unnamed protein product [Bursaphelenchus xylophilus]|uniref:mitogen-activated protein kinase kinase kinase n=1 Tax=Bursaphelenchus xylophilus TaxID=6326 RepID=A0A1I7RZM7_BURXY|nr:unnamed protein product [Bursaphelenchus xylophilus]CAG9111423.1 unnamed protein product [Bursaphelenchus xylophilus]